MLAGVEVLALNDEIAAIAELPVNERAMPGPAIEGDALHVSVCPVHAILSGTRAFHLVESV